MIAQEREAQSQPSADHQTRDLIAQEEMALWAKLMFGATGAAVLLTFAGVVLIWRTLHHTRRAAVSAEGMLREAEKTTEAAVKATAEARRQTDFEFLSMTRLERPYLFVKPVEFRSGVYLVQSTKSRPFIEYRFVNQGRTPAIIQSLAVKLVANARLIPSLPAEAADAEIQTYEVVGPGDHTTGRKAVVVGTQRGDILSGAEAGKLFFYGFVRYDDAVGALNTDYFCLHATEGCKGWFIVEPANGEKYNKRTSVGPSLEIERPGE